MSNAGQNLYEKTLKSELVFTKSGFEVRNAVIFGRNFSGRDVPGTRKDGKKFVQKGRQFRLALNEAQMNQLLEMGKWSYGKWNFDLDNPELSLYTMNVKINMNSEYPPKINLFTRLNGTKNVTSLNSETMCSLDGVDIERCDLAINAYAYEENNYSPYLTKINIIAMDPRAEEFGGYYEEFYNNTNDVDEVEE